MDAEKADRAAQARADLVMALVLVALGLAVIYLSWTMPRLEARRVHPATIPGLVPLGLGVALTICSVLLALRSWRTRTVGGWRELAHALTGRAARRSLTALALVLVYALVLVGWLPFWLASMLFIFAFIVVFDVLETPTPAGKLRSLAWAAGIAVVAGGSIAYVFQQIFLVRLP